jgi:hypothetical protein
MNTRVNGVNCVKHRPRTESSYSMFAMMVIMALVTTFMTGPKFRF